jgi:uridylate kinase
MSKTKVVTKVISLGGSIIAPEKVDSNFLLAFRAAVLEYLETNTDNRLILVCGGGAPAREYQRAYRAVVPEADAEVLDWIGIAATRLNAELLKQLFREICLEQVITDPTEVSVFPGRILVASGWKPGFSTDYDAVLLAERFQADTLLNLSNIVKVYTADPKTHPDARPLERLVWKEFQKLVGDKWKPGINVPFDPVATEKAAAMRLRVIVAAGRNIDNLKKILYGKKFEGTVIGPD